MDSAITLLKIIQLSKTTFLIVLVHKNIFFLCYLDFKILLIDWPLKEFLGTNTIKEANFYTSSGNALAWVYCVHKPADLWDITFCTC